MSDQPRPVWLNTSQWNAIHAAYHDAKDTRPDEARLLLSVLSAYGSAPADALEAVRAVHIEYGCDHDAVLGALGMP